MTEVNPRKLDETPKDNVQGGDVARFSVLDKFSEELPVQASSGGASNQDDDLVKKNVVTGLQATRAEVLANLRQKLLDSKPAKEKMTNEIAKVLKSKLVVLQKDESKFRSMGLKAAHLYNKVVGEIRALQRSLKSLGDLAYDSLKSLWLKLVHNIV